MNFFVTGSAGFIGFHLTKHLLEKGHSVISVDDINDYYDTKLKNDRLKILDNISSKCKSSFTFSKISLEETYKLNEFLKEQEFSHIIHLAAQAGVRHSIENPMSYTQSNLVGFTNILELARHKEVAHLTYASTSSVYGANEKLPFIESDNVDHPLQFYAATKRANELMAHSYSSLYGLPTTGLRFFTVYGPWGRPDMALFKFTDAILNGKPIDLYNNGNHTRDFTYVDDIVESIYRTSIKPPVKNGAWRSEQNDPGSSYAPFQIFNIGNMNQVKLMNYVKEIEKNLGRKALINYLPLQPGDVPDTLSDTDKLFNHVGYSPKIKVEEGVKKFIEWYLKYYS